MRIWLSPTKLSLWNECARCGYDDVILKQKRVRTPFPSLPNGIDAVVKKYMDAHRGSLPPELSHLKGHRLLDSQTTINTYREWNGLKVIRNVTVDRPTKTLPEAKVTHTITFNGGLDDALYNENNEVVVLDVKTKDKEPDEGYGEKWYTTPINSYAWMLKENDYKVADYGFLWYFWPLDVEPGGVIRFGQKLLRMPVDIDAIPNRLDEIARGLPRVSFDAYKSRQDWPSSNDCGFCNYVDERNTQTEQEQENLRGD